MNSIQMYKVAVFSSKKYDQQFLNQFNNDLLTFTFLESRLTIETVSLAKDHDAICIFVNDEATSEVLEKLAEYDIKVIALRCAGFNNVDIQQAQQLGINICRVPEYSPEAVAEHTVGLMLTLSRKFHKAYNRVREDNFALDGLLGFTLHNKTVGIIGTGNIGIATIHILKGFGCKVLCCDPNINSDVAAIGGQYVDLDTLLSQSDIISLHCPLLPATHHLINQDSLAKMKSGAMLINTSRGALIDSKAVLGALKSKQLGYLGIDVYELESDLFFEDLSDEIMQDDIFARLSTFPNVLITGHQGFFTEEALTIIAETTVTSLTTLLSKQTLNASLLLA